MFHAPLANAVEKSSLNEPKVFFRKFISTWSENNYIQLVYFYAPWFCQLFSTLARSAPELFNISKYYSVYDNSISK